MPSVKVTVHMPQHKRLWAELASMEELQDGKRRSKRKHSPGKHLLNPKIIFCGLNKMKRGGLNSLLLSSQRIGLIALIVAKSHQRVWLSVQHTRGRQEPIICYLAIGKSDKNFTQALAHLKQSHKPILEHQCLFSH